MAWIMLCICYRQDKHILKWSRAIVNNFFTQLKNMLDAIAYAEAGDLDAVKQILQAQYNHARVPEDKESKGISGDHPALPVF